MFVIIFLSVVIAFGVGLFFVARFVYVHYLKTEIDMETPTSKFTQSLTFKGFTIFF